jgi:hypothetical protein
MDRAQWRYHRRMKSKRMAPSKPRKSASKAVKKKNKTSRRKPIMRHSKEG